MHYANINKLLSLEHKTALRAHFAIFLPNRRTSRALYLVENLRKLVKLVSFLLYSLNSLNSLNDETTKPRPPTSA